MAEKITFNCKVLSPEGRIVQKEIKAEDRSAVEEIIRKSGEKPIEIIEGSDKISDSSSRGITLFEKKVKAKDLSLFCRQMYTMLHAGMPLIKALNVMSDQLKLPVLKKACDDMAEGVQKGFIFSDAMKKQKKVFPPLLISMVESGEMTGKQDEVLQKMSIHYKKEDRIEKKVKSAMIYPKFLTALTVSVVVIMLTKIMPKFVNIFKSNEMELPKPTQIVLAISNSLTSYWFVYLAVLILSIAGFKIFVSTKQGKRAWDGFILKLPIVGSAVSKIITSRFTRTLSTLLSSGLPLLSSLQMSGRVTGNSLVEEQIDELTEDIKKGSKLSALIKQIKVFPPMLVSMISIGEESGSLEEMLNRTSEFYDDELEDAMTGLVGMIEPIMILVMGVIIGFIVIAMMLPMINLFKAYQH